MPIRAIVDGEEVIAPDLSDEDWKQLRSDVRQKKRILIMRCCKNPGFPRISKLGNKHFVHKRKGECNWEPESVEHIKAKTEIFLACKNAGIEAIPEHQGPDWIADVYVPREKRSIAFEIQWSSQTLEKTWERQVRYEKDNVRAIWLREEGREALHRIVPVKARSCFEWEHIGTLEDSLSLCRAPSALMVTYKADVARQVNAGLHTMTQPPLFCQDW